MKNNKLFIWLSLILAVSLQFSVNAQVSDIEGNVYKTVKIGNQLWMGENLNVGKFRNGDPIPQAKTNEEWEKAGSTGSPAWCYYENDPMNGKTLGKLYNWYAVNDQRGLAPLGWHIPTDNEWVELIDNQGGKEWAGIKMKSMSLWNDYTNERVPGVFEALPGGVRKDGNFQYGGIKGKSAFWWVAPEDGNKTLGDSWRLAYSQPSAARYGHPKQRGVSVRCISN
jgi:uncharacterized protein (TIGR02145 family)